MELILIFLKSGKHQIFLDRRLLGNFDSGLVGHNEGIRAVELAMAATGKEIKIGICCCRGFRHKIKYGELLSAVWNN